jgi:hypothetical protein
MEKLTVSMWSRHGGMDEDAAEAQTIWPMLPASSRLGKGRERGAALTLAALRAVGGRETASLVGDSVPLAGLKEAKVLKHPSAAIENVSVSEAQDERGNEEQPREACEGNCHACFRFGSSRLDM